jgi:hypothetical protein
MQLTSSYFQHSVAYLLKARTGARETAAARQRIRMQQRNDVFYVVRAKII